METVGQFFKTFWAPGETMFRLSKKPRILVPLLILAAVQAVVGIVSLGKLDFGAIAIQQIERSPQGANMSAEQKQNIARIYRQFAPAFAAVGVITLPVIVTIAAALYFGIFTVLGRQGGFKEFYAITAFAYIPLLIRQLVSVVQLLTVPPEQLDINDLGSLSLAVFLDHTEVSKVVYALAAVVDLTSIWTVILLIIGYKFVTTKGVGTGLRATAVTVPYLIFSLIFAGLRMLQTN